MKKTHFLLSLLALGFVSSCQNSDEAINETPKQFEIEFPELFHNVSKMLNCGRTRIN